MRNAEEFSGQRSGLGRVRPAYRRPGPGAAGRPGPSRIRYAHGGAPPRVEPFCTVPTGPAAGHHGSEPDAGHVADFAGGGGYGGHLGSGELGGGELGGGGYGGHLGSGAWLAEFPAGGRRTDLWVLVCGGVAAAAAFAAAFVASGGAASHPAAPGEAGPAVVSQACPSPAPGPTP